MAYAIKRLHYRLLLPPRSSRAEQISLLLLIGIRLAPPLVIKLWQVTCHQYNSKRSYNVIKVNYNIGFYWNALHHRNVSCNVNKFNTSNPFSLQSKSAIKQMNYN
mgnify:FL=1|jgi:hypothetical protein